MRCRLAMKRNRPRHGAGVKHRLLPIGQITSGAGYAAYSGYASLAGNAKKPP
jgi:hypothetical protein